VADCERCSGRGWIVTIDGGAGTARRCLCRSERPLAIRLAEAGVWEGYLHCTRASGRGAWPTQLEAFGASRHLCTILGPVGSGKTHLATAILGEWLAGGGQGRWLETSTALEEIREAFAQGRAVRVTQELRTERGLVVLDDLLSEQATDWTASVLSHVLRYREGRHLPTVLTANVDLVDLDRIEPRLGSRCGAGIVIGLAGADRRTVEGIR
jgi:chromosomal replication initiation ATPase DnaA